MAEVHKHILVKGFMEENPGPDDVKLIENWFLDLVEQVGMKILVSPKAIWCEDDGNEGMTGGVYITTSHSSIHFWQEPEPFFQFDLYSCKDFFLEDLIEMFNKLHVKNFAYAIIDRSGFIPVMKNSGCVYLKGL